MKKNVISSTSAPPQKRMHAHVWFEGYSVLLLHGAARSNTVYEKRLISSVKQLSIKSGTESGGKNYSKVGVVLRVNNEVVVKIWMTKRCTADCTSTSLHGLAYFVIHPSACFVGVCQYVGWMINFLCIKLHQKSSSKFYRREGVGLWRTLQWHFPFQNRFTSGPKQIFASIGEKSKNLRLFFVVIKDLAKTETG